MHAHHFEPAATGILGGLQVLDQFTTKHRHVLVNLTAWSVGLTGLCLGDGHAAGEMVVIKFLIAMFESELNNAHELYLYKLLKSMVTVTSVHSPAHHLISSYIP